MGFHMGHARRGEFFSMHIDPAGTLLIDSS